MNIEFATIINNKPTYFVEKIWNGLFDLELVENNDSEEASCEDVSYLIEYREKYKDHNQTVFNDNMGFINSKIHTIRTDKENKLKVGQYFIPVIDNRENGFYQFAPKLKIECIQKISLTYIHGNNCFPLVMLKTEEGELIKELSPIHHFNYITELDRIAKNSGFNSEKEFLKFFRKTGERKIIHWTNFKY